MAFTPPDIIFLNVEMMSVFFILIASTFVGGLVWSFYIWGFKWFYKH